MSALAVSLHLALELCLPCTLLHEDEPRGSPLDCFSCGGDTGSVAPMKAPRSGDRSLQYILELYFRSAKEARELQAGVLYTPSLSLVSSMA